MQDINIILAILGSYGVFVGLILALIFDTRKKISALQPPRFRCEIIKNPISLNDPCTAFTCAQCHNLILFSMYRAAGHCACENVEWLDTTIATRLENQGRVVLFKITR